MRFATKFNVIGFAVIVASITAATHQAQAAQNVT